MIIVTKIMVFLLVFACLNVVSNIIDFFVAFMRSERLEKPLWKKLMLGVSISYIITIIATGFQLF
jgi:CRISPR/Cas system-associated protein Cas5 (RAMP superfamily)